MDICICVLLWIVIHDTLKVSMNSYLGSNQNNIPLLTDSVLMNLMDVTVHACPLYQSLASCIVLCRRLGIGQSLSTPSSPLTL